MRDAGDGEGDALVSPSRSCGRSRDPDTILCFGELVLALVVVLALVPVLVLVAAAVLVLVAVLVRPSPLDCAEAGAAGNDGDEPARIDRPASLTCCTL